jgi:hypothetical protein
MNNEQVLSQQAPHEHTTSWRALSTLKAFQGSSRTVDYEAAYLAWLQLARAPKLDERLIADPHLTDRVESALSTALQAAYSPESSDAAHLFLHRVLYRINRLKLFWYDDLDAYENERSAYLRDTRDRIEATWQASEAAKHDTHALRALNVEVALRERAAADVDPPLSATGRYFCEDAGEPAYRKLLAIASLDGLVEASQLSRTLGGVSNEVHAMLTRLLLEEYGCGRLRRKHSSYFEAMLTVLGMDTTPEAYFDSIPWQVLAAINHSFLLSERKRHFLRYIGGLLYTEISVPSAFHAYRTCAARLGLSDTGRAYWDLHIKEDERHGRWMLNDIALPLAQKYPDHAWELVLGYDQQRAFSERAGAAVAAAAQDADRLTSHALRRVPQAHRTA